MNTMTPDQAMKIIEDATSMLRLNRNEHQVIGQALNTLRVALSPKAPAKADPKALANATGAAKAETKKTDTKKELKAVKQADA